MANGTGMASYKTAAGAGLNIDTFAPASVVGGGGGFTLYDPSGQDAAALPLLGPSVVFTGIY